MQDKMTEGTSTSEELRALHSQVNDLTANNQRLSGTLREARDQIVVLKEEVERLSGPPNGYAIYEGPSDSDLVVVSVNGRKMRVTLSPE
ncbi:MAG: proteasome ATPase, partial [Actinobacteria bacterium]|nr:proteasome ATPase [Actinomycetota bacterium]